MKTRDIVYGSMLTAFSLVIPLAFGGVLGIVIPPFSATLASHVPAFLSMLVSPAAAVMVGAGSAIGFTIKLGPVIGARAAVHIAVGYAGAKLVARGTPFWRALLLVLPIHALGEALVVLPFGFDLGFALVTVGIGTVLHHLIDSGIAVTVAFAVTRALNQGRSAL